MDEGLHRAFFAVVPPPAAVERLRYLQSLLKNTGAFATWERPEKFHCTLAFLGPTPYGWLRTAAAELPARLPRGPYTVRIDRCGLFPTEGRPTVLWFGTSSPSPVLYEAAAVIRAYAAANGRSVDERTFFPHCTAARAKGKFSPILIQKAETLTFHPFEFPCTDVRLISSHLSAAGSIFTTLFTLPMS